jgi:hypothetical protein
MSRLRGTAPVADAKGLMDLFCVAIQTVGGSSYEVVCTLGRNLDPLPNEMPVCTKKCYDKVKSQTNRRPGWSEDGCDGPNDPRSSERILMDWILTPGNCSKFRGKDNNGTRKTQYAQTVAALINKENVRVTRDAKQVLNKTKHLEDTFCRAFDFSNTETGAGLMTEGTFDEEVQKICPFYFDLLPVMGDRSSAKPKASSDDLSISSDEEDVVPAEDTSPGKASKSQSEQSKNEDDTAATKKRQQSISPTPSSMSKRGRLALLSEDTDDKIKEYTEKKTIHTEQKNQCNDGTSKVKGV